MSLAEKESLLGDQRIVASVFAMAAFLSLGPAIIWGEGKLLYLIVLLMSVYLAFSGWMYRSKSINRSDIQLSVTFFLFSLYLGWSWNFFHLGFQGPANLILISLFLLLKKDIQVSIGHKFLSLYLIFVAIGLFSWILNIFIEIPTFRLATPSTKISGLLDYNLTILGEVVPSNAGDIYRFQAMFDEPGLLGTVSALLLCSKLWNGWAQFLVLLLSGLASMSAAFIVICVIYLSIIFPLRSIFVFLPFSALIFWLIKGIPFLGYFIYTKIVNLLFEGSSNRVSSDAELFLEGYFSDISFLKALSGSGYGFMAQQGVDISSLFVVFVDSGLIGVFLLFLGYIILWVGRSRSFHFLPFLIVFFVSIIQRPGVYSYFYFIIFYMALITAPYKSKEN